MMRRFLTALSSNADPSVGSTLNISILLRDFEQLAPTLTTKKNVKVRPAGSWREEKAVNTQLEITVHSSIGLCQ